MIEDSSQRSQKKTTSKFYHNETDTEYEFNDYRENDSDQDSNQDRQKSSVKNKCNKDHSKFIPISEMKYDYLPKHLRHVKIMEFLNMAADLTVKLSVLRNLKCGTGRIVDLKFRSKNGTICQCRNCKGNPEKGSKHWAEITVLTNEHVVRDKTFAQSTIGKLYYNEEDTDYQNSSFTHKIYGFDADVDVNLDKCFLKCATCDSVLIRNINKCLKKYHQMELEFLQKRLICGYLLSEHFFTAFLILMALLHFYFLQSIHYSFLECWIYVFIFSRSKYYLGGFEGSFWYNCINIMVIGLLQLTGYNLGFYLEFIFFIFYSKFYDWYYNSPIIIISHPHGKPKQITIGSLRYRIPLNKDNSVYYYDTCTCPGSSGAPIYGIGLGKVFNSHIHRGYKKKHASNRSAPSKDRLPCSEKFNLKYKKHLIRRHLVTFFTLMCKDQILKLTVTPYPVQLAINSFWDYMYLKHFIKWCIEI